VAVVCTPYDLRHPITSKHRATDQAPFLCSYPISRSASFDTAARNDYPATVTHTPSPFRSVH
jgi:hypothetical protein